MSIRIGIANYAGFSQFIDRLRPELPEDVELVILNDLFDELERTVRRIEVENSVDVFVGSGGNADFLEKYLSEIPLVKVQITGFDILQAVKSARHYSERFAVITRRELPRLNEVKDLLKVDLRCLQYSEAEDLNAILAALYAEGIHDVIGSAFVIEQAALFNQRGHFIYSLESIRSALTSAIYIARTRKEIAEKAKMLDHLMEYAAEGIIITDREGIITHFNKSAEQIIGRSRSKALGKSCAEILPNTQLLTVMREKRPQYNRIQDMGNVKIVTNRCPIIVNKEVYGALATFFSVGTIKQAGESIRRSQSPAGLAKTNFSDMSTESPAMQQAKRIAERYARSLSSILLLGESGTGKAMFAQCIHNASSRKSEPYIAMDCAAFPQETLEAELFGAEEVSSGGKRAGRAGCLERAVGGTLFIDNIHLLPLPVQTKLMHALEDKEYRRSQGEQTVPANIRLISATTRDLKECVRTGQFREELYFQICVLELSLPSLRERKEDIPLLIRKFLLQTRSDMSRQEINTLCSLPEFTVYRWPGNVRELRSVVERFCSLYVPDTDLIALVHEILAPAASELPAPVLFEKEREEIREALKAADGNRATAADILGVSRTTLWRRMKELGL